MIITAILAVSTLAACPHLYRRQTASSSPEFKKTYVNTMTANEWQQVKDDIQKVFGQIMTPTYIRKLEFPPGPGLVRLAFHDAGSYDINTNTGGPHADVDLNAGENKGLKRVTDLLEPIYLKNNGKISRADLWSLSATMFISNHGGPNIQWRPGRADVPQGQVSSTANPSPGELLPNTDMNITQMRTYFQRLGLNDREIVAILGAHTLGTALPRNSEFLGSWTTDPEFFNNQFFERLVELKENPGYYVLQNETRIGPLRVKAQWEDITRSIMMISPDVLLVDDPVWYPIVKEFARDKNQFYKEFAAVFQKMSEFGMEKDLGAPVSVHQPDIISYSGDQILVNPIKLNYLFYGNWTKPQMAQLVAVGGGLSKTTWWDTMREYYHVENGVKKYMNGDMTNGASVLDSFSLGNTLVPGDVPKLIELYVAEGKLTAEKDAVYLFFPSNEVKESSKFGKYCFEYCQYHDSFDSNGQRFVYVVVGAPSFAVCITCGNVYITSTGQFTVDSVATRMADILIRMTVNPYNL